MSIPSLHHARYDTETKILYGVHNAGFYSCVNEVIKSLTKLLSFRIVPDSISFSETLRMYKEDKAEDYFPLLFRINPEKRDNLLESLSLAEMQNEYCCTILDPIELNFANMSKIMDAYFSPSESVRQKMQFLESEYSLNFEKTIGVSHRGNDKWREANLLSIENWITETRKLLNQVNNNMRILFCSDELSSANRFMSEFGDICSIIKEHSRTDNKESTNIPIGDKKEWSITLDAMMRIVAKSEYLLTHSGNGSYTALLYRGNLKKVTRLNVKGEFVVYDQ